MILRKFAQLRLVVLTVLLYSLPQMLFAQSSILYNFNSSNQLTSLFNGVGPGLSSVTQEVAGGLGNSGSIAVPLSSSVDAVYTTKDGYSLGPIGSSYVFESFIKSEGNGGYSGVGFTTTSPTTASSVTVYRPDVVLGISVHGGGFIFHNNGTNYSGSWGQSSSGSITAVRNSTTCTDLINSTSTTCGSPDRWYKLVFKVTRTNTSVFDMRVEIWPANVDGTLRYTTATAIFEVNGVTNTSIASAAQLFSFFNFSGTRVTRFDNYSVNLAGGSTVVQAGYPVVLTPSLSTNNGVVTVNGNVTSANGGTVTERGIVYGTSSNPTISNNKIVSGSGIGTFSGVTPTLSPGTYYFRAYAISSAGTSYGAELTTTICSQTLPNVRFKLSPPNVSTSAIQGQVGARTENFNSFTDGIVPASGTYAIGNFVKTGTNTRTEYKSDAFYGAPLPNSTTLSRYLGVFSGNVVNVTLTEPSKYLGFWWAGGDDENQVTIFGTCGGNEIQLGQFTTSTVTTLLSATTVTAIDGNSYNSSIYRRSNAGNSPFAYVNLELDDPNISFTRLEFTQRSGGGGFEVDNITTSTVYGAASSTTPGAPNITSITPGVGTATVNFTAPTSNGGQAITNYEYSIDDGNTWVASSPAATTSPMVIPGLAAGTTYPIRIRAVNSIGSGAQSNSVNGSPTDPTCNTFSAGDFQTNNNATYANNIYTLTPNQGGQNGSAWNKNRLFLDQNFDISARVYLGNSDAGADGIAFVLQNQSLNAGSSGGGLGYAGITPSFAVEFDTYNNGSHEPAQDHLAIIANGNAAGVHNTYSTPFEVQMEDGQWHTVRFVWNAASKNFQVFYDGTRRHNITVDLKANIFGGAPYVYWGFTGATGGATNLQQVQFDSYCYVQQVGVTALAGTNNSNAALAFCEGSTVRLQASPSTSYQWLRNGTAINGETGRELIVSTSGAYTVQAVSNQNTTLSEVVNVNVTLLPVITYASSYSFERTRAISTTAPTLSGGTATSYSISPALPTGLTFNTTNASITGTPSVVSASATYTVTGTTASGCIGRNSFTLSVFNAVAPSALSYAPASQTVRQGTAITAMVPSASGGVIASYSISPALPAGLSFNTTTGIVSGTLTAAQTGSVTYTITATNSGGSTTATVTLIFNTAPTDLALNTTSVAENAASATTVGTLSATDADAGDTFTYSLVSGTGSTDNASFSIVGSSLNTAAVFDFETKSSYSVRVRVTDAGGLSFEKAITISVTNVNEAPTDVAANANSVAENATSGTSVATMSATDVDAGDTFTYTLVSGTGDTDNASFAITGSALTTAAVFDFETKSSYSVRVRVTDAGGLSFERAFTITVTDVNEAPTLTAILDRRVYNVATSQIVNLAGITAGPETAQTTTTSVSTSNPSVFSAINVVGTQIQFTLAAGIATPQDVVVTVRVRDNGGVANGGVDTLVRTFRLGIDPMPVATASPNLITLGATAQLSATGANAVNYTWVAVGGSGILGSGASINVRPRGTTTYAVVVTNSFGYQATIPVLLTVIVDYKLVPNNLLTPNGDGVNDKWVIPNIDMYPDNEVMVYDKAGRAVFAKRGYNNEWDGTVNGKLLKEDAYFYVIKFNKDGALPIRGYVSIVR